MNLSKMFHEINHISAERGVGIVKKAIFDLTNEVIDHFIANEIESECGKYSEFAVVNTILSVCGLLLSHLAARMSTKYFISSRIQPILSKFDYPNWYGTYTISKYNLLYKNDYKRIRM